LALILDVLVATDAADPNSRAYASPRFRDRAAEEPPLPPSFAFVRTPMWDKADPETQSALEELAKEVGAREIDLPADYAGAWPPCVPSCRLRWRSTSATSSTRASRARNSAR